MADKQNRVTRMRAARILGVSRSQLQRLEKEGEVPFEVDENGVHLFDPDELEALRDTTAQNQTDDTIARRCSQLSEQLSERETEALKLMREFREMSAATLKGTAELLQLQTSMVQQLGSVLIQFGDIAKDMMLEKDSREERKIQAEHRGRAIEKLAEQASPAIGKLVEQIAATVAPGGGKLNGKQITALGSLFSSLDDAQLQALLEADSPFLTDEQKTHARAFLAATPKKEKQENDGSTLPNGASH